MKRVLHDTNLGSAEPKLKCRFYIFLCVLLLKTKIFHTTTERCVLIVYLKNGIIYKKFKETKMSVSIQLYIFNLNSIRLNLRVQHDVTIRKIFT